MESGNGSGARKTLHLSVSLVYNYRTSVDLLPGCRLREAAVATNLGCRYLCARVERTPTFASFISVVINKQSKFVVQLDNSSGLVQELVTHRSCHNHGRRRNFAGDM